MGSRSTHLRAAFGGFHGRALQAGDQLCLGSPSERTLRLMAQLAGPHSQSPASWSVADLSAHDDQPAVIRVLRGDQFSWLDADSQHTLYSADFEVTRHADRMGYRLAGPTLRFANRAELLSEAVCCGTIQLPPEGQLIVLMADCATTGGYPKIAHVASVDLPRMAQIPPSGKVRFAEIGIAEAQQLYRAREATFERMKLGILSQEEG
jgi:antagonist of KipI